MYYNVCTVYRTVFIIACPHSPPPPSLLPLPLGVFSVFSGSKGKSPKGPGGVKLISTNALSSLGEREGGKEKEKEGGREGEKGKEEEGGEKGMEIEKGVVGEGGKECVHDVEYCCIYT